LQYRLSFRGSNLRAQIQRDLWTLCGANREQQILFEETIYVRAGRQAGREQANDGKFGEN